MSPRLTRITTALGCVVAAVALTPAAAARAAGCEPAKRHATATAVPFVQQLYDFGRLAPLATGKGVRVAVIDSGVDATHPQLAGHNTVDRGRDFLHDAGSGRQDCNGHGTKVASLIAARPAPGTPFQGLAPGATIVPVRVSELSEGEDGRLTGDSGSLTSLARAISWAADPHGGDAQVINLSLSSSSQSDDVRQAVADALARGVVIVAAAGNEGKPEDGNPTPYPAAYPGVIGVAAVNPAGVHDDYSGHGDFVDLAAPGDNLTAAAPGGGHVQVSGTSMAAPLVAATAALILQRFPGSSPQEVARRLTATADPAPGGANSPEYGSGLLDPYRALTETLAGHPAPAAPPAFVVPDDPAARAARHRRAAAEHTALILAAAGASAVLVVGLAASAVRSGRRRGWHPGRL